MKGMPPLTYTVAGVQYTLQTAQYYFKSDAPASIALSVAFGNQTITKDVQLVRVSVDTTAAAATFGTPERTVLFDGSGWGIDISSGKPQAGKYGIELSANVTMSAIDNTLATLGSLEVGFIQIVSNEHSFARYTDEGVPVDRYYVSPHQDGYINPRSNTYTTNNMRDLANGSTWYADNEPALFNTAGAGLQAKTIKMNDTPELLLPLNWNQFSTLLGDNADTGDDYLSGTNRVDHFRTFVAVRTKTTENGAGQAYFVLAEYRWVYDGSYSITKVTPQAGGGITVDGAFLPTSGIRKEQGQGNGWVPVPVGYANFASPTVRDIASNGSRLWWQPR